MASGCRLHQLALGCLGVSYRRVGGSSPLVNTYDDISPSKSAHVCEIVLVWDVSHSVGVRKASLVLESAHIRARRLSTLHPRRPVSLYVWPRSRGWGWRWLVSCWRARNTSRPRRSSTGLRARSSEPRGRERKGHAGGCSACSHPLFAVLFKKLAPRCDAGSRFLSCRAPRAPRRCPIPCRDRVSPPVIYARWNNRAIYGGEQGKRGESFLLASVELNRFGETSTWRFYLVIGR